MSYSVLFFILGVITYIMLIPLPGLDVERQLICLFCGICIGIAICNS